MTGPLRRGLSALLAALMIFAPVAGALAAAPQAEAMGDEHHGSRLAPEDGHWWLGKSLIPVDVRQGVADLIGPQFFFGDPAEKIDVGHIFVGIIVLFIGLGLALAARRKVTGQILPPQRFGAAALFDLIMEALLGVMESLMPRERAIKYLPLMTAVCIFILLSNVIGLVPGFLPPTQNLNTTFALGFIAFVFYNVEGVRAVGIKSYLAHFAGPIPLLAPLMFPIEIVSHLVRPVSLAIRLAGNMFGDHQVVFVFLSFAIPLMPLPIMALGLLVCIIQTVVFTMLFIVYVALATAHHDHDDDHADDGVHGEGAAARAH